MRSQGLNFKTPIEFIKKKKVQGITFTRDSVAWTKDGKLLPANTPDFSRGSLGVYQSYTNILKASQSNCSSLEDISGYNGGSVELVEDGVNVNATESDNGVIIGKSAMDGIHTFSGVIEASGDIEIKVFIGGASNQSVLLHEGDNDFAVSLIPNTDYTQLYMLLVTPGTIKLKKLQLTQTAYPLPGILGGTTRAVETMAVPPESFNIQEGTILLDVYVNEALKSLDETKYIVDCNGTGYLRLYHSNTSDVFVLETSDGTNVSSVQSEVIDDGWHTFKIKYGSVLSLSADYVPVGSSVNNPHLPSQITSIKLGSYHDATGQINTTLKNVLFDKKDLNSCVVDKNNLFASALQQNLIAFKEVRV